MAIRLITVRNYRGVYTCKNNKLTNSTPCGIHTNDTCHYVWQKAQTVTIHYTAMFVQYGLNRVRLLALILGNCRCADELESK